METAAEVIERPLAFALAADDHVRLEPDEISFGIEVDAPAQVFPIAARLVKELSSHSSVGQGPPAASGSAVEGGRVHREGLAVLLPGQQAATGRRDVAPGRRQR